MALASTDLKKILVGQNVIKEADFVSLESEAAEKKQSLADYLIFRKTITEDNLQKLVADFLDVPSVDLTETKIAQEVLKVIPEPIARRHQVIAFRKKDKELDLAMTDPEDLQTREFVKKKTGFIIKPYLATKTGMDFALSQYHSSLKAEFEKLLTDKKVAKGARPLGQGEVEGDDLKKMAEEIPVVRVVDTLLEYAIFEGASDIHIEPQEREVTGRYRIDGMLHDVMTLPKVIQPALVARLKVLANLKIDEHRLDNL